MDDSTAAPGTEPYRENAEARARESESLAGSRIQDESYRARLQAEESMYRDCAKVHDLPAIFHYWSERYVRPKLEAFGFSGPNGMFCRYLAEQCDRRKNVRSRFVSIGSGNCDLEIELAVHLRALGHSDFVIDCLDLNTSMLERGRSAAVTEGVADQLHFVQEDCNQWNPAHEYDAVIANQALHHVLNLEHLFAQIKSCLKPYGSFIISDIIGRNGNQRWPEALKIVNKFWRKLPPSYRFNQQLGRYEELYENWDCSRETFEGIRSQDILPLLLDHFHFRLFFGFANVIDPFVDRAFGHNFDATAPWDRAFIDEVHERDEKEMISGHIKPTHMLAVVGNDRDIPTIFHEPLSPRVCLRSTGPLVQSATPSPDATNTGEPSDRERESAQQAEHHPTSKAPRAEEDTQDAYEWHTWPHSSQTELEIACRRLREATNRLSELTKGLEERTAWALRLEKELEERTAWALRLNKEVEEQNAWALRLDKELQERCKEFEQVAWARHIHPRVVKFLNSLFMTARDCRNRIRELVSRHHFSE
jgi:SAM-dependent methyltransferase